MSDVYVGFVFMFLLGVYCGWKVCEQWMEKRGNHMEEVSYEEAMKHFHDENR